MRNFYQIPILLALLLLLCCPRLKATQLTGAYTIDSLSIPTATNFRNFTSAITYLNGSGVRSDGGPSNSAPFGVSGPVVFNVAAGTYPIAAMLSLDPITGTSLTNTVTFTGGAGNASSRILNGSLNSALFRLNGCKYVTIKELTLSNQYAGICTGITIKGNATNNDGSNCTIKNCVISIPNSGIVNAWGINITTDANGISGTATGVDSLRIDSNTIMGGFYGVHFTGMADTLKNVNNAFRNNNMLNTYSMGIRTVNIFSGHEVSGNLVKMNPYNTTSSYGISIEGNKNPVTATVSTRIFGNTISAGRYGLNFATYTSFAGSPVKIYNNMITIWGDNVISGLYLSSATAGTGMVHCIHNTAYTKNGELYTFYYNGSATGSIIKNNIFIASTPSGYAAQFLTSPAGNDINYNVYYNTSGGNLIKRGTTDYNSLTYRTATAGGDSSSYFFPSFVSAAQNDLHLSNVCTSAKGVNLSTITGVDIDGETRLSVPQCGSDEVIAANYDLAIEAVVMPVFPVVSGTQGLSIRLRNAGIVGVSSANLSFQLNGGAVTSEPWSGILNPCDTAIVTFSASLNLVNGKNVIKVFSANPNATTDGNRLNDTIVTLYYPSLSGNYTIGGATPDFNTFAEAANALKSGVVGATAFIVRPGTYTEQVVINGPISGVSLTNNITFDGVDSSVCIITDSLPTKAVVLMNQCKYVGFRNFTIRNKSISSGTGVGIVGNFLGNDGTGCSVKKCKVIMNSAAGELSYGITVTNSEDGFGAFNNKSDSVQIDSNTIIGGYYGIVCYGIGSTGSNRDFKIRGNIVQNAYLYGIFLTRNFNVIDLLYNKVTMYNTVPTAVLSMGINHQTNTNSNVLLSHRIIGNTVLNASRTGIQIQSPGGGAGNPNKIHNNMVGGSMSNTTNYGIYMTTGGVVEYLHNTVNIAAGSAGTTINGMYFNGTAAGNTFKNNIFSVTSSTGSTVYPANFSTNPTGTNVVDYNQYYNGVSTVALYRGAIIEYNYIKSATGGGLASVYGLPAFKSTKDYHITDGCSQPGLNLSASVPFDIDGETRSIAPQIGCDEYHGATNDISVVKLISPLAPIMPGLQDVIISVKNKGNNIVNSFNVSYSFNGGAVVSRAWTGTLNPCDTVNIVFSGANQVNLGATNLIQSFTDLPNGFADTLPGNDTLQTNLYAALSGVYTIGTGGNFTTFTAACDALANNGIQGAVTFNVLPGTYTEQVTLNGPIPGSSAINTIVFNGIDSSNRILTATAASLPVFRINKASYVTVKNLTISNLAATGCTGIALVGGTTTTDGTGFTLKGCTIRFPNTPSSTGNVFGVLVTGVVSGNAGGFQLCDSITIDSNTILGANYGIQISNTAASAASGNNRGHKIRRNNLQNAYAVGINFSYVYNAADISYNTINLTPGNNTGFGINSDGNQNTTAGTQTTYIGNTINAGLLGIYLSTFASPPGNPVIIQNNMVTLNSSFSLLGLGAGVYLAGTGEVAFYHNSIFVTDPASFHALYYNSTTTGTSYFKNNILSVVGTNEYPAYFNVNPSGTNVINYNNYYNAGGGNLVYRAGALNASTYKTTSGGGDSSVNVKPEFVSPTNLHVTNACIRGIDLSASVPKDIDGTARSTSPVIGAHEAIGFANDIAIEDVSYVTPVDTGLQGLTVRVKNYSTASVLSMNIHFKLNNNPVVTYPWVGTLVGCDTVTIALTGAYRMNIPSGANILSVYLSQPNGVSDNNKNNDTLKLAISTVIATAGNAIKGTGVSNTNYIRLPGKTTMNATTAFTAEAWVKLTNATTTQKIVARSTARTNGFSLGVQLGGFYPEIWTVASGATPIAVLGGIIPINKWTHIAMTWESGVGMKTYVNGSLVGSVLSATPTTMSASFNDLIIGMNSWDNTQAALGTIDEVRLWNIALDTLALRKNMHCTVRKNEPGLISYVQLNETTSGTLVCDPISGSSGTVVGALIPSMAPLGGDTSMAQNGAISGGFNMGALNALIYDGFDNPCGFTITEVPQSPNVAPTALHNLNNKYWVLRTFGNPGTFAMDLSFDFPAGYLVTTDPSLALYRRAVDVDSASWVLARIASSITATTATFSGIDTLGQFSIASNGTSSLPVSLLMFSGKHIDNGTRLTWETASELNNKGFEIERSTDGNAFEKIGYVSSLAQGSTIKNRYTFTDNQLPKSTTIYYRLKQLDNDGNYKYSPVVVIETKVEGVSFRVFPNPASSTVNVEIRVNRQTAAIIEVYDILGKRMIRKETIIYEGNNTIEIQEVGGYKNGLYIVRIIAGELVSEMKLEKN